MGREEAGTGQGPRKAEVLAQVPLLAPLVLEPEAAPDTAREEVDRASSPGPGAGPPRPPRRCRASGGC
eukprot:15461182-Alexandrium_andersonii.AAC.1